METVRLVQGSYRKTAIILAAVLLSGTLMVVFNESLVIQFLRFEQSWILQGEDRWDQGPEYMGILKVNSSNPNATLEIPWSHHLEIAHFNITPGPATIIVSEPSSIILNHTLVSGDYVTGLPPPTSSVSFYSHSQVVGHNITAYYEGVNSTVFFFWSSWASGHFDYMVLYNRTVTVTASVLGYGITGFTGAVMIVASIFAIVAILGTKEKSYKRMKYDDKLRA